MQLSLFDYRPEQNTPPAMPRTEAAQSTNDYHMLPASEKQLRFAKALAARTKDTLSEEICADRRQLSQWIDAHKSVLAKATPSSQFSNYPSSKQVAFAERIARIKRRQVPPECFRDKGLMSKWIDGNR